MSKISLKHSSGNSMSIGAPATNPASDLELKLPATVGTAGQVLQNSSTPGTLEFAAGGDYAKLATAASDDNVSSIVHEGIDFSVYRGLYFMGGLIPATNNTQINFYWRSGGTELVLDQYLTSYTRVFDSTPEAEHADNQGRLQLCSDTGDDDDQGAYFWIFMFPISNTADGTSNGIGNYINWQCVHRNGSDNYRSIAGSGLYDRRNVSPNGFSIMPGSGDFDHYSYSLYGIKR